MIMQKFPTRQKQSKIKMRNSKIFITIWKRNKSTTFTPGESPLAVCTIHLSIYIYLYTSIYLTKRFAFFIYTNPSNIVASVLCAINIQKKPSDLTGRVEFYFQTGNKSFHLYERKQANNNWKHIIWKYNVNFTQSWSGMKILCTPNDEWWCIVL